MSIFKENFIWSALGFFTSKTGIVLSILFASHFLNSNDYAQYSIFLISINVFSGIMSASLSLMANRYSYKKHSIFGLWITIQFFSLASSLLYFIYAIYKFDDLTQIFLETAYVFGNTYFFSLNGIYFGQGRIKEYAFINIIFGLWIILISTSLIYLHNYVFLIGLTSIPLILYNIWSSYSFVTNFPNKIFLGQIKRGLQKVFLPNIISGILFQPAILIAAELLLNYSSDSDLFVYSVTNQIRMVLTSVSVIIGSVIIKQLITSKDRLQTNMLNLQISFYPIALISSFLILSSEMIFHFFGKMIKEDFILNIIITSLIVIITSLNSAFGRNFVVDEKGRIGIYNNLTWIICFIISSILLIPYLGSLGANIAFLISSMFQFIIWLPFCIKNEYLPTIFFDFNFLITLVLVLIIVFVKFYSLNIIILLSFFILLVFWTFKTFYQFKTVKNE